MYLFGSGIVTKSHILEANKEICQNNVKYEDIKLLRGGTLQIFSLPMKRVKQ